MLSEFKRFIMRGNVVDLAVGVIIGASFNKIVSSLVEDIIMPPLALVLGKVDFSSFFVALTMTEGPFATIADAKAAQVPTWNIGLFANTLFQFLLVAFAIFFFVVKPINKFKEKEEEQEKKAPPKPTRTEELLEEIRDSLKKEA